MNSDLCLKSFISYDREQLGNSCWIDSLFVALFHTYKESINKFINNLEIKKYINPIIIKLGDNKIQEIFIKDDDKNQLEKYETNIVEYLRNIYSIINFNNELEKKNVCYNIRITLEKHKKILINNNILKVDTFFSFVRMNSPYELLLYLKQYILDIKCFDNFQLFQITRLVYNSSFNEELEKQEYLSYYDRQLSQDYEYKDINVINIFYGLKNREQRFFENSNNRIKDSILNLFLHSIMIREGLHYTCYYKCDDKWYFYNDTENYNKRTISIGTLNNVMNHIDNIRLKNINGKAELTLLYLKNDENLEDLEFQQAIQNSQEDYKFQQAHKKPEEIEDLEFQQAIQNSQDSQDDDLEMEQAIIENFKQQQLKAKEDLEMQEAIKENLKIQQQLQLSQLSQVKYPKPNKIHKLKELVDEHFERLKNLIL